jgi:methionyl-tRNA formyltransferase
MLKVLLCGYGPLGLALLEGLLEMPDLCEVVGVFQWSEVRCPGYIKLPKRFSEPEEVALGKLCKAKGVQRLKSDGMNGYAFTAQLLRLQPDIVLVGSWGEILRPHIWQMQKPLFINCHPSLLPVHRGANPYASVILAGEAQSGVSFHRIVSAVDAGPLLLQAPVPLTEGDTGADIRERCSAKAKELLPKLLLRLKRFYFEQEERLEVLESPQNEWCTSFFPAPRPEEGRVQWQADPTAVCRFMRARFPWAMAYSTIFYGWLRVYFGSARLLTVKNSVFKGELISYQQPTSEPGKILSRTEKKGLLIATLDSDSSIEVDAFYLALGSWRLPGCLNQSLAWLLLRPGQYFI